MIWLFWIFLHLNFIPIGYLLFDDDDGFVVGGADAADNSMTWSLA